MKDLHVTAAQVDTDAEGAHVARSQQLADEIAELSLSNLLEASEETVEALAGALLNDQAGGSTDGPTANVADPLADVDVGTGVIDDV